MGLFDEFRRRWRGEAAGSGGDAEAELPGPSAKYLFGHMALPHVAFDNPGGFLAAMSESNPDRQKVLQHLWGQARAHCPYDAEAARIRPVFRIEPFLLLGRCGILIGLPEPRRPAEAYFACVLVQLPKTAGAANSAPPPTWFFTLERMDDGFADLLPPEPNIRIVAALRRDPTLLPVLMRDTMFRGGLLSGLNAKFGESNVDRDLAGTLAMLLKDPEALARDPSRLAPVLDELERQADCPRTVLGGWTPEGQHLNYGVGSRPEKWAFLADLAVLLAESGGDGSHLVARSGPRRSRSGDA